MDTLSHGLWGSFAFGRRSKKSFLLAFLFGIAPDLFSFGPFFVGSVFGLFTRPPFSSTPPPENAIPFFVHLLYRPTHSFIIFAAAFFIVWLIRQKPLWEMSAWGLHVLYDIPFHEQRFFPTPFLWPVSSYTVDGVSWAHPLVFIPNVAALIALSVIFLYRKKRAKKYA